MSTPTTPFVYVPKEPEDRIDYVRQIQAQQGWTDSQLLHLALAYAVLDGRFVIWCEGIAERENEESEDAN